MQKDDPISRLQQANKLLLQEEISTKTFNQVQRLSQGIHPSIDKALKHCQLAIETLKDQHQGETISLSTDDLGQKTQKDRLKKKSVSVFLASWSNLRTTINRHSHSKPQANPTRSKTIKKMAKLARRLKAPLGVGIIAIVLIVVLGNLKNLNSKPLLLPGEPAKPADTLTNSAPNVQIDQNSTYHISEASVNHTSQDMVVWSVRVGVVPSTGKPEQFLPANDITLEIDLRNSQGVARLAGKTSDIDGWVHWVQPAPEVETHMVIISLQGSLQWPQQDQSIWKNRVATTFKL